MTWHLWPELIRGRKTPGWTGPIRVLFLGIWN
jgi:hypothetical protein